VQHKSGQSSETPRKFTILAATTPPVSMGRACRSSTVGAGAFLPADPRVPDTLRRAMWCFRSAASGRRTTGSARCARTGGGDEPRRIPYDLFSGQDALMD